jgi:hypothetical protein
LRHDYLTIPMSVLKNIVRKHRKHTKRSVHLAKGLYWTDPEKTFAHCPFHDDSSSRCNSVISKLESQVRPYPGECTFQHHSIFDQHPNGAAIVGRHPEKLLKRQISPGEVPTGSPLGQAQSSDSGVDMNSRTFTNMQGSSSVGTGSASTSSRSSRRSKILGWFGRQKSGQEQNFDA